MIPADLPSSWSEGLVVLGAQLGAVDVLDADLCAGFSLPQDR